MSPEWLHWYYLIFLLPAAIAVFVLLLSGLGGQHGGHGHAHHGGFHSHGPAGGAHGHAHVAGNAPAAHGHGTHAHAPQHAHGQARQHAHATSHGPGVGRTLLGLLGVGHAPITIVIGSLMIVWGIAGIGALEVLRPVLRSPALFVPSAVLFAGVTSLVTTGLLARLAARAMPQPESTALARADLVGLTGKVVYTVSDSVGRVHIFDQHRTLHSESARVAPGLPSIERGTEVIVSGTARGFLLVEPLGFDTDRLSPQHGEKQDG